MAKSEKMVLMLDLICESPGELTAPFLAKTLDVSERAIYRYLSTWQRAGVYIRRNGRREGGYRVMNMQWYYVFKQKEIAKAVEELITRGLKQCMVLKGTGLKPVRYEAEELIKQGEEALRLLKTTRA